MIDTSCPLPDAPLGCVTLAHGAGGKAMHDLIQSVVTPFYGDGHAPDHDGAVLVASGRLAFTTDSYVVKPIFFPGGDIGRLAVYGTINDLSMCGAKPLYLSCSLILEEGLPLATLARVCASIAAAARETGVRIVTGDTKVVGRGQADGIYINTSGVGSVTDDLDIHPRRVSPGDKMILSGDLGRHGIAVMTAREQLLVEQDILSDCAPLSAPVGQLLTAGVRPKCLRDLTRGGLAAALHEIARTARVGFEVEEIRLPVSESVQGICEILGLDPLYIANEGRFIAIVSPSDVASSIDALSRHQATSGARVIGTVTSAGYVEMISAYGPRRILPELQGELLPRIC